VDDPAGLADAAIGGREQGGRIGIDRARTGLQLAGEEGVEVLVGEGIRLRRLGHVHAVVAHDGADQPVLPRREGPACAPVDQARQEAVLKELLQQDLESHPAKYTGLPERFAPLFRAIRCERGETRNVRPERRPAGPKSKGSPSGVALRLRFATLRANGAWGGFASLRLGRTAWGL